MKSCVITDFLTDNEIALAQALYRKYRGTGKFAKLVDAQIITPNIKRINAALGQANDPKYLAYAVEQLLSERVGE